MISVGEKSDINLYACFIYSPSWELERRRRSIVDLDEEFVRQQKEENDKKETDRLRNVETRIKFLEYIFPIVLKYYQESERKREEKRHEVIREEVKLARIRNEAQRLKQELDYLINIRKNLIARLTNFKIFKDYLSSVCSESNGKFQTVGQLLEHFNFVIYVRYSHILKNQQIIRDVEELQIKLALQTQESNKVDLDLQNKLIEMKRRQNQFQAELESLEDKLADLKSTISSNLVEPARLKLSIYNLYSESCDQLEQSLELDSSDVCQQVRFIQDAMRQVREVRKDVQEILSPSSLLPETEAAKTSKPKKWTSHKLHSQNVSAKKRNQKLDKKC